jgi:hypothetical protein
LSKVVDLKEVAILTLKKKWGVVLGAPLFNFEVDFEFFVARTHVVKGILLNKL